MVIALELEHERLLGHSRHTAPPDLPRVAPARRGHRWLTRPETYRTKTGKVLTDSEIEAMADEAERGYNVETLKARRRGRPMLGTAPAEVVPVRLDPDLKRAVEVRAEADHTTTSEIIREALRRFLDVA